MKNDFFIAIVPSEQYICLSNSEFFDTEVSSHVSFRGKQTIACFKQRKMILFNRHAQKLLSEVDMGIPEYYLNGQMLNIIPDTYTS